MKNIVVGFLLLAAAGCGVVSDTGTLRFSDGKPVINPVKEPTPAKETQTQEVKKDVVFEDIQVRLFNASCINCHNPERAASRKRADLTKKEVILENFDEIIARMLRDKTEDGYMPPRDAAPISRELIAELQTWKQDPTYANLKKNLFDVSCTKCHNPENQRRSDLTSKQVILEKYDIIVKRINDTAKPMPPVKAALPAVSPILLEELRNWKERN